MPYPIQIQLPSSLDEITLGQWIDYTNLYGKDLDARLLEIGKLPDCRRKGVLLISHVVYTAYCAVAFFNGLTIEAAKEAYSVEDVMELYNGDFNSLFLNVEPVETTLPDAELSPSSIITFGEFIDSKVIVQASIERKQSKWELLQYICAIFLRPDEDSEYQECFVDEDNDRFTSMRNITMATAMTVMLLFEDLNKFIEENFSLFHESDAKEGAHMKLHFAEWGWVNFLKSIAKTKIYDIPNSGLNSIECARRAKLYEVLIDASEEKAYNLAMQRDMEAAYNK